MAKITETLTVNTANHLRVDYNVDNIFLNFPNQQKNFTFVNGTASERTIAAGTLVGITTADQTIAAPLESDATDGSQIPYGILLYDTVIPAGASEEVEALVGYGDNQSSIFADMVVLEKVGDTLNTVITELGISIRNAIMAYMQIKIEPAATNVSDYKDAQV
jgi:hypothetical protein